MSKQTKTILVTGATAGIGRHAALHLAARGHHVIATGRRPDALAALGAEASAAGSRLDTLVLDVTDQASIDAAVRAADTLTSGHGVDVLVNNAGYGQLGPLELISDADVRKQFETNVFGLLATTRAFLPSMRRRGAGRIVNVSSVGGRVTFPLGGAYHASKYAVEAMSDALRRELATFGIDVVVVEPGPIATEFSDRALQHAAPYVDPASPYAPLVARAQQLMSHSERFSAPAKVISEVLTRAIESRRPHTRYVAPFSSRVMLAVLSALPARVTDALLLRATGGRRGAVA